VPNNCFDRIYWIKKSIPLSRIIMFVFLDPNPVNPVKNPKYIWLNFESSATY